MEPEKLSIFENGIEWIKWFKIVLSPTLLFGVIGVILKFSLENETFGNCLFALCLLLGITAGILWANKVKKKHGTTHFISRTDASPDIDVAIKNKKSPKIIFGLL